MDLRHNHGSIVYVLRASYSDDAPDLLACGGEHSVQVLHVTDTAATSIASFHVGSRVTALAWSSRTISPSCSDEWFIELAAATADFGLHLLSKSPSEDETIFRFGGGLSGHHGKVTGMAFSGGRDQYSSRYVATVSDDKTLMVWDLNPSVHIKISPRESTNGAVLDRPQPTAFVIPFAHPLTSVSSHPSTSKNLLVSDARGSIFLTDWRSDPPDTDPDDCRHSTVVELVEPHALADALSGVSAHSGMTSVAAWRADNTEIIGAAYGSKFAIWDLSHLRGGKPTVTGFSFSEGGNQFRWCPTLPEYFAVSTTSPLKGAQLHIHNTTFINTQPATFTLAPRPAQIRDFDFLATQGVPRIAAAVGQEVVIFHIGIET